MEENEVVHGEATEDVDDVFADASADNLEALLGSETLEDKEVSAPDESEESKEPVEDGETEEEEEKSKEDEYYSEEDLDELSKDIDNTKFDRSKVKPGSLADKTLKNLESGYNKKYEGFSNKTKELEKQIQENSELISLRREVSDLKNQPNQMDSYFEKQRIADQEKRLAEEEALLDPEERESRKKSRETLKKITDLENKLSYYEQTMTRLQNDQKNADIDRQITDAVKRNELPKKEFEKAKYAIINQWQEENTKNKSLTSIDSIVDAYAGNVKASADEFYEEEKLDKFLETDKGKTFLKKQMTARLEKLRKLKKTSKNISSDVGKSPPAGNDDGIDVNKVNRGNLLEFLGGTTI